MSDYDFLTSEVPITQASDLLQDDTKILDVMAKRRQLLRDEEYKQPLLSQLKTYMLSCDTKLQKHIYTTITRQTATDDNTDTINALLWYFSDKTLEQTKKLIQDIYNISIIPVINVVDVVDNNDSAEDDNNNSDADIMKRLELIQTIIKTLPDLDTNNLCKIYDYIVTL